jgi:hypothetical protein
MSCNLAGGHCRTGVQIRTFRLLKSELPFWETSDNEGLPLARDSLNTVVFIHQAHGMLNAAEHRLIVTSQPRTLFSKPEI